MSQIPFSTDWLKQFSDPYAVLGLSVAADDRRVLKRYRTVAKLLHPDTYSTADPETKDLAIQLFARLVNPAYQRLKQEKGRAEIVATLRFRVRRMTREQPLEPQGKAARQLLKVPVPSVDVFYEQQISELVQFQFEPLTQFETITQQLEELNLVYLQLKMGEPMIREKRTGIVSAAQAKPMQFTPVPPSPEALTVNYAQRHYQRAQEYMKKSNWPLAVQELRDAIRIESNQSEYHSLLATAYLMQNLPKAATAYFRQALKLNPNDPLALSYAKRLKIEVEAPNPNPTKPSSGGLFGRFARKR